MHREVALRSGRCSDSHWRQRPGRSRFVVLKNGGGGGLHAASPTEEIIPYVGAGPVECRHVGPKRLEGGRAAACANDTTQQME